MSCSGVFEGSDTQAAQCLARIEPARGHGNVSQSRKLNRQRGDSMTDARPESTEGDPDEPAPRGGDNVPRIGLRPLYLMLGAIFVVLGILWRCA